MRRPAGFGLLTSSGGSVNPAGIESSSAQAARRSVTKLGPASTGAEARKRWRGVDVDFKRRRSFS